MVERVAGMAQALASHLNQIAAVTCPSALSPHRPQASPPGSDKAKCAVGISRDSLLQVESRLFLFVSSTRPGDSLFPCVGSNRAPCRPSSPLCLLVGSSEGNIALTLSRP
jgi:hypothetical protein